MSPHGFRFFFRFFFHMRFGVHHSSLCRYSRSIWASLSPCGCLWAPVGLSGPVWARVVEGGENGKKCTKWTYRRNQRFLATGNGQSDRKWRKWRKVHQMDLSTKSQGPREAHTGPQAPTRAQRGPHRPTGAHTGPCRPLWTRVGPCGRK